MVASAKSRREPSLEIQRLADKAAELYRKDKLEGREAERFSDYARKVLEKAGLLTDERVSMITRILGRRGGRMTQKLVRAGVIQPQRTLRPTRTTPRFSEFLFNPNGSRVL